MVSHALRRTSPKGKGQKFIGVCTKCGVENIPLERMHEDCPNVADFSNEDALLIAIKAGEQDG